MQEKRCTICDDVKPLDEFPRASDRADGRDSRCLACNRARGRAWKAANRERVKAYTRRYYLEAGKERTAEWRKANPEKVRESGRQSNLRQRQRHPERVRAREAAAYAKRRALGAHITVETIDREAIIRRDGSRCWMCRKKLRRSQVTLDHLIPVSKGGPHVAWNVAVACRPCNSSRRDGRAGSVPAQLMLLGE